MHESCVFYGLSYFETTITRRCNRKKAYILGNGVGIPGPILCLEPRHCCELDVATSKLPF